MGTGDGLITGIGTGIGEFDCELTLFKNNNSKIEHNKELLGTD